MRKERIVVDTRGMPPKQLDEIGDAVGQFNASFPPGGSMDASRWIEFMEDLSSMVPAGRLQVAPLSKSEQR